MADARAGLIRSNGTSRRAPQSGTLDGIEVRWTNRCDGTFASPPCAVLNRVRAAVLNLCVARIYGRIGCILRLTGRANWSFGGRVSITELPVLAVKPRRSGRGYKATFFFLRFVLSSSRPKDLWVDRPKVKPLRCPRLK